MKFFSVKTAIQKQLDSITEREATENFEISCKICCESGFNISCSHCPVASAHEQKCAAILDLRRLEKEKELKMKDK